MYMLMTRGLGNMPGATLFGMLLDYACVIWNRDQTRRYCIQYDTQKMAWYIFSLGECVCARPRVLVTCVVFTLRCASVLANIVSYLTYKEAPDRPKKSELANSDSVQTMHTNLDNP
jgi:hypothetical protein